MANIPFVFEKKFFMQEQRKSYLLSIETFGKDLKFLLNGYYWRFVKIFFKFDASKN